MTALSPEIESTYEVLGTMGGGMGAVYKVRHRLFDETRIIKVLQTELAGDQDFRDRFSAEAKRGKQLEHPNIAKVLDFQIGSNGAAHLVMEYIEGVNLRDEFVRRGGPLPPATVVMIGVQTLAALGYLHARHLIHRDISPDNLMITKGEEGAPLIKLIDLGIAKSLEETSALTRAGHFMGKISYASPEQFGGAVDGRSDFYSLGVVLYELLTAVKPITGANTMALILAHCQTPPRPFSQTDPQGRIPNELRVVVLKALEKNPDDRYQSAEAFATALQAALPADNRNVDLSSSASGPPPPLTRTVTLAPSLGRVPPATPMDGSPAMTAARPVTGPTKGIGGPSMVRLALAAALVAVVAFLTAGLFAMLGGRPAHPMPPGRSSPAVPVEGRPAGASIAIIAQRPPPESRQRIIVAGPFSPAPPVAETAVIAARTSAPVAGHVSNSTGEGQRNAGIAPRGAGPEVAERSPEFPDSPPTRGHDLPEGDRQRKQALAFSTAHQWPSAIAAWRQFLRGYAGVRPAADHAAYYNLGIAYESLQEWQEATDAFEHARLADPIGIDTNNLLHLGRCYGKAGRWSEAASTYESILSIDPANDMASRNLALARRQETTSR